MRARQSGTRWRPPWCGRSDPGRRTRLAGAGACLSATSLGRSAGWSHDHGRRHRPRFGLAAFVAERVAHRRCPHAPRGSSLVYLRTNAPCTGARCRVPEESRSCWRFVACLVAVCGLPLPGAWAGSVPRCCWSAAFRFSTIAARSRPVIVSPRTWGPASCCLAGGISWSRSSSPACSGKCRTLWLWLLTLGISGLDDQPLQFHGRYGRLRRRHGAVRLRCPCAAGLAGGRLPGSRWPTRRRRGRRRIPAEQFPAGADLPRGSGSAPLGLLGATLRWLGSQRGLFPLWVAWLAFSPFIVDATWTLLRRLVRGERVWQAHRSHHYQRLVLRAGVTARPSSGPTC